jgi:hypothetical protein
LGETRARTERVFANLFENAIDAMRSGGSLSLRGENDGDNIMFRVQDTGPGIGASLHGDSRARDTGQRCRIPGPVSVRRRSAACFSRSITAAISGRTMPPGPSARGPRE